MVAADGAQPGPEVQQSLADVARVRRAGRLVLLVVIGDEQLEAQQMRRRAKGHG